MSLDYGTLAYGISDVMFGNPLAGDGSGGSAPEGVAGWIDENGGYYVDEDGNYWEAT
jgi:hypothetical protein